MEKVIAVGAEAALIQKGKSLIKRRIKKGYRHQLLDSWIRARRTRRESKILAKVSKIINSPKVIKSDDKKAEIEMEFIDGKIIGDHLDSMSSKEALKICFNIGSEVGLLHSMDIIHGDLTTSNMILNKDKISLIDFGLGFHSVRPEDKAVDLRLLNQALRSKHFKRAEEYYKKVLAGYKVTSKDEAKVFAQLKKVEARGRYKGKKKQDNY